MIQVVITAKVSMSWQVNLWEKQKEKKNASQNSLVPRVHLNVTLTLTIPAAENVAITAKASMSWQVNLWEKQKEKKMQVKTL